MASKMEQYRSAAEVLVAGHAGDKDAVAELQRAYNGATSTDAGGHPAYVKADLALIASRRPMLSVFAKAPLPAQGMRIEYPVVDSVSIGGDPEQTAEGNDAIEVKLSLSSDLAPVKTLAASTSLSVQLARDEEFVAKALRLQQAVVSRGTDRVVRDVLLGLTGLHAGTVAATTAKGYEDVVLDAKDYLNDQDAVATAWLINRDDARDITDVRNADGASLFLANDGATLNGAEIRARVGGVPLVIADIPAGESFIVDSRAIRTRGGVLTPEIAARNVSKQIDAAKLVTFLTTATFVAATPERVEAIVSVTH